MHLTNVDNQQVGQTNVINTYLGENALMWMTEKFGKY